MMTKKMALAKSIKMYLTIFVATTCIYMVLYQYHITRQPMTEIVKHKTVATTTAAATTTTTKAKRTDFDAASGGGGGDGDGGGGDGGSSSKFTDVDAAAAAAAVDDEQATAWQSLKLFLWPVERHTLQSTYYRTTATGGDGGGAAAGGGGAASGGGRRRVNGIGGGGGNGIAGDSRMADVADVHVMPLGISYATAAAAAAAYAMGTAIATTSTHAHATATANGNGSGSSGGRGGDGGDGGSGRNDINENALFAAKITTATAAATTTTTKAINTTIKPMHGMQAMSPTTTTTTTTILTAANHITSKQQQKQQQQQQQQKQTTIISTRKPTTTTTTTATTPLNTRANIRRKFQAASEPPPLYVITPTYRRPEQLAELTRLGYTLKHVGNLLWLVIEDANETSDLVMHTLNRIGVPYEYLMAPMPEVYKKAKKNKPRGVSNRNRGLEWLRQNASEGVFYFADDDNTYDITIFEQMRYTKKVSMWPVGLVTKYGVSSPIVRGGKLDGFYDGWIGGRKYPVDMAGFAVSVKFLHERPKAQMPYKAGYEEDGFLKSLAPLTNLEIELLASNCTEILTWHTQTKKNAAAIALNQTKYHDTNLVTIDKSLVRP